MPRLFSAIMKWSDRRMLWFMQETLPLQKNLLPKITFGILTESTFFCKAATVIWEREIEGFYVVACHFAMRVWPRSNYNSCKQWDIGVDNNDFYPVSFNKVHEIMRNRPDNPNFRWRLKEASIGQSILNILFCRQTDCLSYNIAKIYGSLYLISVTYPKI
jgi:hypothetical protein